MSASIDRTFRFGGAVRQSFGTASPAYAAAFIVLIILGVWVAFESVRRRPIHLTLLCVETGLAVALASTMTRAAFVALAVVAVGWAVRFSLRARDRLKPFARVACLRIVIYAIALFYSGAIGRFTPGHVRTDKSVTHRIEYWRAGFRAIGSAPWGGCGWNTSQRCWMNWYRPVDSTAQAYGFSNAFLDTGFEFGVPGLAMVLAAICILGIGLVADEAIGGASRAILFYAQSATVAALVENAFSTLVWSQLLLGLEFLLAIATFCLTNLNLRRLGASAALGLLFGVTARSIAARQSASDRMPIQFHPDGTTSLGRPAIDAHRVCFWADTQTTGTCPGVLLRRMAIDLQGSVHLTIAYQTPYPAPAATCDLLVILGTAIQEPSIERLNATIPVIIVHPLGPPPEPMPSLDVKSVVRPEIDDNGFTKAWRSWSIEHSVPIQITTGAGTDISDATDQLARDIVACER